MGLRRPRFAGTWYPGTRREIEAAMKRFDREVSQSVLPPAVLPQDFSPVQDLFGGIVPHAGWYFSGKTAYSVYRSIDAAAEGRKRPDLFFVFGMHLPPGGPNYLYSDEGFDTPVGPIRVNQEGVALLRKSYDFVEDIASESVVDNTIELQLPFIGYLFPEAEVLTLGISPDDRAYMIGERAFQIARELGKTPCFIGSTDLTHYGPNYGFVSHGIGDSSVAWVKERNDREIIDVLIRLDPAGAVKTALASHNACCPGAAAAAMAAVRKGGGERGWLVDYTTSYDRNPDSSFVGYAGILY